MRRRVSVAVFVAVVIALCGSRPLAAADAPIEAFFGNYVGTMISTSDAGLTERDLGVSIEKGDGGFSVNWTTITRKPDGRFKRKAYFINFRSTRRAGIYSSAMKTDKFGARVPLDPLAGEPYVWARVRGQTLTVFALLITDDGGYEMQVYDRTLVDDGLHLKFSRFHNGQPLREITAVLVRPR